MDVSETELPRPRWQCEVGQVDRQGRGAERDVVMELAGDELSVQAGAGIVADSNPENEFEECMNKASALLRACERASG